MCMHAMIPRHAIKTDQSAESGFEYWQHFTCFLSLEDGAAVEEKSVTDLVVEFIEDKIRELEGKKDLLPKGKS